MKCLLVILLLFYAHRDDKDITFHGGKESLRHVLHDIGFRFKKKVGRRYLVLQPRIQSLRYSFAKLYHKLVIERKLRVIFLDETWIYIKGSNVCKEWTDGTAEGSFVRSISKGARFIVVHAGGRDGWVEGAGLLFASKGYDEDYHDEMKGEVFEKFIDEQLLPNLPSGETCVIVFDRARYHGRKVKQLFLIPIFISIFI